MSILQGLTDEEILAGICPCGAKTDLSSGRYRTVPGDRQHYYVVVVAECPSCGDIRWENKKFANGHEGWWPTEKEIWSLPRAKIEIPDLNRQRFFSQHNLDALEQQILTENVKPRPHFAQPVAPPVASNEIGRATDVIPIPVFTEILDEPKPAIAPSPPPMPVINIPPQPNLVAIDSPRVLIGESIKTFSTFEGAPQEVSSEIFWDPNHPEKPLNNFGVLITGDSGSGKTQIIRAIIHELAQQKVAICVFDFKNDYSDKDFIKHSGLKVYDLNRDGLPFNPLHLVPDEDGNCQPIRQIHEFSAILGRVFMLGDQQQARLRRGICRLYEDLGYNPTETYAFNKIKKFPSFSTIKKALEENSENETLLNRLSFLIDLNLFPDSHNTKITFEELIKGQVSLDFHRLPTNPIKAILAEFIIVRLHGHMLRDSQPRKLRHLLVFDEAWRVRDSERLQELAREGRAFGIGFTIGTQFPGDIEETLSGSLATQIFLYNKEVDHQKGIAKSLCGSASNTAATAILDVVSKLQKHEGLFKNQQYSPGAIVRTLPHYKRI